MAVRLKDQTQAVAPSPLQLLSRLNLNPSNLSLSKQWRLPILARCSMAACHLQTNSMDELHPECTQVIWQAMDNRTLIRATDSRHRCLADRTCTIPMQREVPMAVSRCTAVCLRSDRHHKDIRRPDLALLAGMVESMVKVRRSTLHSSIAVKRRQ